MTGRCGKDAVHWDVYEEPHPYDSTKIVREMFGCCGRAECHKISIWGEMNHPVNPRGSAICGQFEIETVMIEARIGSDEEAVS